MYYEAAASDIDPDKQTVSCEYQQPNCSEEARKFTIPYDVLIVAVRPALARPGGLHPVRPGHSLAVVDLREGRTWCAWLCRLEPSARHLRSHDKVRAPAPRAAMMSSQDIHVSNAQNQDA